MEQKISSKVEAAIRLITEKEWKQSELQSWFNNVASNKDIEDFEKEILVELLEGKIRANFPSLAKKIFGNKDGKAIELLTKILSELETDFDFSDNRVGTRVKTGGDQMGGGTYIDQYISYKNADLWNTGLAYRQEELDTEPRWWVTRYHKGEISNPNTVERHAFAIDDIDLAILKFREFLGNYCQKK